MKATNCLLPIIILFLTSMTMTLFASPNPMEHWMELYAESGSIINHRRNKIEPQVALALYEKISRENPPTEIAPEVELLKAQLLYYGGKETEAFKLIDAGITKYQTLLPDWSALKLQAATENDEFDKYIKTTLKLGAILPVSTSGREVDTYLSRHPKDSVPPDDGIYRYGSLRSIRITKIAEICKKNWLYTDQINLLMITIYAYSPWQRIPKSAWEEIAITERRLGHEKLATIAFLRAAQAEPKKLADLQEIMKATYRPKENRSNSKIPHQVAEEIADAFNNEYYWPWAIDILKRADQIDTAKIAATVKEFESSCRHILKFYPEEHRWGKRIADIKDYENFHLPKPTETFWNEETLYQPKNQ